MTDVITSEQPQRNKQEEIRAAKEKMAGPIPLIEDAPDTTLILPRGFFQQGAWHRRVEVRELTGADEETLAKVSDQLAFFSTVIALGVVSIGDVDFTKAALAERKFYLGSLLLGEREQVFLKVVQASFGNKKVIPFTCTLCDVEQDVTLLLDEDFKPKEVDDLDTVIRTFVAKNGDTLEYSLATGADQEEALGKKGASPAEQNTIMLSRCVTKRNGGLIPDQIGYARALSISDRQKLLQLMVDQQPSVSLEVSTTCAGCGGEQRIALGWADLFRP